MMYVFVQRFSVMAIHIQFFMQIPIYSCIVVSVEESGVGLSRGE